jgi:hypothetical protein
MQPETKTLRDYLAVLRRRKTQFAAVAGTLFVIAWAVAWWLPAIYRSTATIMIEQQEIPQDLVGATISSFADQRIQVISQQAMSRASLMQHHREIRPVRRRQDRQSHLGESRPPAQEHQPGAGQGGCHRPQRQQDCGDDRFHAVLRRRDGRARATA